MAKHASCWGVVVVCICLYIVRSFCSFKNDLAAEGVKRFLNGLLFIEIF